MTFNVIKILGISSVATTIAVLWAPFLINFLYKHKLWKKSARQKAISGEDAVVFNSLHKEREVSVPRFGGVLIWGTTGLVTLLFFTLSAFWGGLFSSLNFLSRSQTWLPLFTLLAASLLGLIDDFSVVSNFGKYIGGGMSFKKRLIIVASIGLVGALWFYYKLGWDTITLPVIGQVSIGLWYIPLFIIVMLACWSGGVIDGIDGLAGGAFASMFGAFSVIAFAQGQYDLATFCMVIVGSLFAFLWFNIPPARFYMSESGSLGLTATLSVVAFLTDSIFVLPIIAGLLVLESGSVIVQLLSKKFLKRKIFLSTPIHHHFEAKGWTAPKVTMRAWIVSIALAILGTAVRLLS